MGKLVKVASTAEIPPGSGKLVEVEGKRIAVFNVGGRYHAMDDTCPHRGARCPRARLRARPSPAPGTAPHSM